MLNAAGLVVRDADSLNGVFVKLTSEEELLDGDIFRIGQELLRFDEIPAPEPLDDGTEIIGSPNPGYWGRLALIVGARPGRHAPSRSSATRSSSAASAATSSSPRTATSRARTRAWRCATAASGCPTSNSSNGTFIRIRGERAVPTGSFVLMGQQLFRVAYA